MRPHYEDGGLRLWHGANLDILPTFPDASFDSIVTDPPYELGFMGKGWDSSGIAYSVDVWRECLRVLKPGGHLLSFGGTRTWHRIAVAIEDAGFEVRDSIAWMYGSGMPKSHDVAQAVDKLDAARDRLARAREFQDWLREHLTAQRVNELTATDMGHHLTTHPTQPAVATVELFEKLRPFLPNVPARIEELVAARAVESKNYAARAVIGQHRAGISRGESGVTAAGQGKAKTTSHTPEAAEWEGWGTALKPAFEPIIVARKPFRGTVAANVIVHGTGALNIGATRVPHRDAGDLEESTKKNRHADFGTAPGGNAVYGDFSMVESKNYDGAAGRWPTNVLVESSQAAMLDAQSNDASRFFPTFRYEAKAPTSERPNVEGTVHATVKPLELMRWLVRLVTRRGGRVLDIYAGSGTTGEAALLEGCEVDLIEMEADHIPLILARVKKPLQPSMFGDWEETA